MLAILLHEHKVDGRQAIDNFLKPMMLTYPLMSFIDQWCGNIFLTLTTIFVDDKISSWAMAIIFIFVASTFFIGTSRVSFYPRPVQNITQTGHFV
jgi:Ca2+-dependent lipid-binding protein